MTNYEQQANSFLTANHVGLRITFHDNQTCPLWEDGKHIHGDRYRVTIYREKGSEAGEIKRFSFDFWNSYRDSREGKEPTAYDVLSCISSDAYTPETFSDFCSEFGCEEDSRKALKTFKAVDKLARRIRAFFSESELEALAEIR